MRYFAGGLNRTLCDVLNAMRKCDETKNYSYLLGLIEEAQAHGDAMEAALYDQNDIKGHKKHVKKLVKKIKKLESKESKLEGSR